MSAPKPEGSTSASSKPESSRFENSKPENSTAENPKPANPRPQNAGLRALRANQLQRDPALTSVRRQGMQTCAPPSEKGAGAPQHIRTRGRDRKSVV